MSEPADRAHPALVPLLQRIVDRIDAVPFEARSRELSFPLNQRTWPELFAQEVASEREFLWQLLRQLASRPGLRLALDERRAMRESDPVLRHPRLLIEVAAEPLLRRLTGRELADGPSWSERWKEAVRGRFSDAEIAGRLLSRPIAIAGREPAEILDRFEAIRLIAEADLTLNEVASRQFWGLSKALEGSQDAIALLLGVEACPFPDKPVQLLVAARTDHSDAPVLFVENAATFETLAAGRIAQAEGLVLVFASGYRASARRIRTTAGSSCYFAPSAWERNPRLPAAFDSWLRSGDSRRPVFFWGDLDYAGIDILKTLKAPFPQVRAWEPGYAMLLDRLHAGHSHAPEEARKGGQSDPGATGCSYADGILLPALRESGRFVDQESV